MSEHVSRIFRGKLIKELVDRRASPPCPGRLASVSDSKCPWARPQWSAYLHRKIDVDGIVRIGSTIDEKSKISVGLQIVHRRKLDLEREQPIFVTLDLAAPSGAQSKTLLHCMVVLDQWVGWSIRHDRARADGIHKRSDVLPVGFSQSVAAQGAVIDYDRLQRSPSTRR